MRASENLTTAYKVGTWEGLTGNEPVRVLEAAREDAIKSLEYWRTMGPNKWEKQFARMRCEYWLKVLRTALEGIAAHNH